MRLPTKKITIIFIFVVSILLVFSVHFIDRAIHCKMNGLIREDALEISIRKLEVQFRNSTLLHQFTLVSEQFETDNSWIFTYKADSCIVAIIIDNCGVSDVGGLSKGCISVSGNN